MTKVLVWPADTDACAAYRLELPARAVAAATDWTVEYSAAPITLLWDRPWDGHLPPPGVRCVGIKDPIEADVVVMQRPARRHWSELIPLLQKAGIRVVVDMDDNFDAIAADHISHATFNPRLSPSYNRLWAAEACRLADVVTVTTPALLAHYGHGHGVVLPNLIPESYLKVEPDAKMRVVGWSGSVATHPGDLESTDGAVARALRDCPEWGFHVIGTGERVKAALRLAEEPSNTGKEGWVPFHLYPTRLAELSVGIIPLIDSPFNHGKSALKLLEMSAVGVAAVASPTPDNCRLSALGAGELARRPIDWMRKLRALMRSDEYRADVAGRSREVAATQTYEALGHRWAEAWHPRK